MIIVIDPNVIALQNTLERINITIQNNNISAPVNVNPASLSLQVMDIGGNTIISDSWTQSTQANRIVQDATGQFHIDFGYQYASLASPAIPGNTTLYVAGALPIQ